MAAAELPDAGSDVAPASAEAAELQAAPHNDDAARDRDMRDAEEMPKTSPVPQNLMDSQTAAERPEIPEDPEYQHSPPEIAAAESDTIAPSMREAQPAAAEPEGDDREHQAAAGEEAAAEPEQAEAAAGVDAGVDEGVDEDIEVVFEEAQDVFETPSQHPRMMTPGTAFGTARQQPTAYKTGQEHLTGTGSPAVSGSCQHDVAGLHIEGSALMGLACCA